MPLKNGFKILENNNSPLSLGGLVLWLDANDYNTLTFNGSNVSQWNDKSGYDNHVTQSTPSDRPLYNATGFNGRPTLDFDGVSDKLDGPNSESLRITDDITIFVAIQFDNLVIANDNRFIAYGAISETEATNGIYICSLDQGKLRTDWEYGNGTNVTVNSNLTIDSNPAIYSFRRDATSKTGYFKFNENEDSDTYSTNATGGTSGSLTIASPAPGATADFEGLISEILIYNRLLSVNEMTKIETYFSNKYGI